MLISCYCESNFEDRSARWTPERKASCVLMTFRLIYLACVYSDYAVAGTVDKMIA